MIFNGIKIDNDKKIIYLALHVSGILLCLIVTFLIGTEENNTYGNLCSVLKVKNAQLLTHDARQRIKPIAIAHLNYKGGLKKRSKFLTSS